MKEQIPVFLISLTVLKTNLLMSKILERNTSTNICGENVYLL